MPLISTVSVVSCVSIRIAKTMATALIRPTVTYANVQLAMPRMIVLLISTSASIISVRTAQPVSTALRIIPASATMAGRDGC